jgi:hypothetical protein
MSPSPHETERVEVAVSPHMERLRTHQQQLNHFLWSTELSYGLVLVRGKPGFSNLAEHVSKALKDVESQAWYPSTQGRIKYDPRVSGFLDQVSRNTTEVYQAVLIRWYSYFEQYLEERVRPVFQPRSSWGPLTQLLGANQLTGAGARARPKTVVQADLCRHIRNRMVHDPRDTVDGASHPTVKLWRKRSISNLAPLLPTKAADIVDRAIQNVIGHALALQEAAKTKDGKDVPLAYFYMLFAFTNFDTMAFEIEESLIPAGQREKGRITRKSSGVRRRDLIV